MLVDSINKSIASDKKKKNLKSFFKNKGIYGNEPASAKI